MVVDYHIFLIVFLFILLDILTGVTQAVKNKTLSSVVMREGIYHKAGYILILALALLAEYSVNYMDLGFTTPLVVPCSVMICLTEFVSISENIERITPELAGSGIFKLLSTTKKRRSDDEQNN